jgi:type VI secretion system secreted protein VgrG
MFDLATLIDAPDMKDRLELQPYKIYLSDGSVKQVGVLNNQTLRVYTSTSERIRCEIGTGDWAVEEDGYDESDIEQNQTSDFPV